MAVITTGSHPKELWPGVKAFFGSSYDKLPETWKQIFEIETSDKAYEEEVEQTGTGLMPVKADGDAIVYDTMVQGYTKRYTNVTYGMGIIATRDAMEDGQYEKIMKRAAAALAFSAKTTKETVHANILNRWFNSSYVGGDGVCGGSASHPTLSGNQSNILATAADLSEASLEDLCVQIMNAKNSRSLRIGLTPKKLIVSPSGHWDAKRIIESDLQSGTANNDKNVIGGMFSGGLVTWPFLDDADAWFVQTNAPHGLKHMKRRAGVFEQDNDFDTENAKAKFTERYAAGHTEWRGLFSSAGA